MNISENRMMELQEYAMAFEPMSKQEVREHIVNKRKKKGLPPLSEKELIYRVQGSTVNMNGGRNSMFKLVDPAVTAMNEGERIMWARKHAAKGPRTGDEREFVDQIIADQWKDKVYSESERAERERKARLKDVAPAKDGRRIAAGRSKGAKSNKAKAEKKKRLFRAEFGEVSADPACAKWSRNAQIDEARKRLKHKHRIRIARRTAYGYLTPKTSTAKA